MLERRDDTPAELLTWCRFETLLLLGSLLAYIREREGTFDAALDVVSRRRGDIFAGGEGVEAAMLGLRLSLKALGAEVRSVAANPEEGELVVGELPGEPLVVGLEDRFELSTSADELLGLVGLSRQELTRLYDLLGLAAAGDRLAYARERLDDGWRLTLRA